MKALFQLVSAIQEWRVGMSDPIGDLSGRILQRWIFLLFPSGATRDYFFSSLCRNIQFGVFCAEILVRYCCVTRPSQLTIWIGPMSLECFLKPWKMRQNNELYETTHFVWGSCRKIEWLRKGPDRDQCPRKVKKKARFASQVTKFNNSVQKW